MQSLKSIKGTHDILPAESARWQYVESSLRELFAAFYYKEVRTPVFESTSLFARGVGEFSDIVTKEMYSFQDKGGESLTLRPELTASVVRSYIQHHYWQDAPIQKLWYIGPLFRQERPQAGRQRQFHQFGTELIGSALPQADAEVIALAWSLYRKLGLKNIRLHVNSIGSNESRKKYTSLLRQELEPFRNDFCTTCQSRFDGNILRLFDCKNPACSALMKKHAPSILDHLSDEDSEHFHKVCTLLDAMKIPYTIDHTLVRGLDYYTRTTFEIKSASLGAQDALCGGGRYDNLIADLGGPETPAVGFAAGMERLMLAIDAENLFPADEKGPDLYLAPMNGASLEASMQIAAQLRMAGFSVDMDLLGRSVKAMLRDANRKNARFVAVIGDKEIQKGSLQLKDMWENTTYDLPFEEILKYLEKTIR